MPAKHYIDNNAKLIITTWEGDAIDMEFIAAIKNYQEEIQINPECIGYNEVVNFSKVTSIKLTPKGIKTIGKIAVKTDRHKADSKLAIVVSSGIAFNLARTYASYRGLDKNSKKEIRIFKSQDDATEWTRQDK